MQCLIADFSLIFSLLPFTCSLFTHTLPTSILHFKLRLGNISLSHSYLPLIKWISCENYHVMQTTHTQEPSTHDIYIQKISTFVCSLICESFFISNCRTTLYTLFFSSYIYYVGAFSVFVCYFSILTKDSSCRQQLELCVKCQLSQWIWMNKCTTSHGGNKLIACAQFTNTHTHTWWTCIQNVSMKVNCFNNFINNFFNGSF